MKILILLLICILSLGSSVYYLQKILKSESYVVHGPYVCDDKEIKIMQDISNDLFEGATVTKGFYISFDNNFFHYVIYPTTSTSTNKKKEYIKDNTSSQFDLNQEVVVNILNDFGIGGSHTEEIISDTNINEKEFLDFGKCFNLNAREIYTDIAKRQKVDGNRFSYSIFSKAYNRK